MINVDVLIIGAGPGGIAAAVSAAKYGKSVLLVDDSPDPGGQIWRAQTRLKNNAQAQHWVTQLNHPNIQLWPNTRFVRFASNHYYFANNESIKAVSATQLILATGAQEIVIPFKGWTLSQVCGAGGLQALIKNGLRVEGKRIVIAGTGPLLLASAQTAKRAGANVIAMVEQASFWQWCRFGLSLWRYPSKWLQLAQLFSELWSIPYWRKAQVVAADGDTQVRTVTIKKGQQEIELDCDWLACAYGLEARLELSAHFALAQKNGSIAINDEQRSSQAHIFCVGEITGIGGAEKALIEGQLAAAVIANKSSTIVRLQKQRARQQAFVQALRRFCALDLDPQSAITQDEIVCRCEDVRHQQLLNCNDGRQARLYTRVGMGACQGRICGPICQQLYGWSPVGERAPWTSLPLQILLQEEKS